MQDTINALTNQNSELRTAASQHSHEAHSSNDAAMVGFTDFLLICLFVVALCSFLINFSGVWFCMFMTALSECSPIVPIFSCLISFCHLETYIKVNCYFCPPAVSVFLLSFSLTLFLVTYCVVFITHDPSSCVLFFWLIFYVFQLIHILEAFSVLMYAFCATWLWSEIWH